HSPRVPWGIRAGQHGNSGQRSSESDQRYGMSVELSLPHPRVIKGFTMIEILVTLVILMIGLLGIAGLMAQGQRASFEAYQRQQALALANDMAERVKANRPGVDNTAVTTTYAAAVPLATPTGDGTRFDALATNCATSNCTTS